MNAIVSNIELKVSDLKKKIDWPLLVFLLLFLNVKLVVKAIALIFLYCLRPNLRFGFSIRSSRLPLFYPLAILLVLINYVFYNQWNNLSYSMVCGTGILFWVMSLLAMHQLKLSTERTSAVCIHFSLLVFFLLNSLVSCWNLLHIIIETGALNPYRYQGMYQKYFISTGDYIKGISFDTSTTNAVINALGVIYFIKKGQYWMVLLCMTTLLLTCSNFVNLLLSGVLCFLFFSDPSRNTKSMIIVCFMLLILFLSKVSPQNNEYAIKTFQQAFHQRITGSNFAGAGPSSLKQDDLASENERKLKIAQAYMDSLYKAKPQTSAAPKPAMPKDDIDAPAFQHVADHSEARAQAIALSLSLGGDTSNLPGKNNLEKYPGKVMALQQTLSFFKQHPHKLITGDGAGNFSSKLAFRTTGLKVAGGYPAKYSYISNDFRNNHLAIFLHYFCKDSGFHSITNTPNSVYAQIMGEYGLLGLLFLGICYLYWFFRNRVRDGYTVLLLLLLCGLFFIDYWFEQLSIVILFELFFFMDQKKKPVDVTDEHYA